MAFEAVAAGGRFLSKHLNEEDANVKTNKFANWRWLAIEVVVALGTVNVATAATTVISASTGTDMSPGTLTVTFMNAGAKSTNIMGGPAAGEGSARVDGFFSFSVVGETFNNDWTLNNLTTSDFILSALFDLRGSSAIFDDGAGFVDGVNKDTPGSEVGRKGADHRMGVAHLVAAEEMLWPDPVNRGDEYLLERLRWLPNTFGSGQFSKWRDDTDTFRLMPIPEPATAGLFAAGCIFAVAGLRRRRG